MGNFLLVVLQSLSYLWHFSISLYFIHVNSLLLDCSGSEQVYEFVQLSELYYAGSHGMDIMGPAKSSSGFKVNGTRVQDKVNLLSILQDFITLTGVRCTDKLFVFFKWLSQIHSNCLLLMKKVTIEQGNDVVFFQPASEFLPLMDTVCTFFSDMSMFANSVVRCWILYRSDVGIDTNIGINDLCCLV